MLTLSFKIREQFQEIASASCIPRNTPSKCSGVTVRREHAPTLRLRSIVFFVIRDFPQSRGTLFGGPYNKDPTI